MPQDIPVEASDELVFIPASLEKLPDAPSFVLRAATTREKRYHRRLQREEGVAFHNQEALREEMLKGLRAQWSTEQVEEHSPILKAYWQAFDDYTEQKAAHDKEQDGLEKPVPYPEFEYDQELKDACEQLFWDVAAAWKPLAKKLADNEEFNELVTPLMVAAVVQSWTGLKVKVDRQRGYLTLDGAEALREAVLDYEQKNGIAEGIAWLELFTACAKRMYLDQDEAKNSASPSPSETTHPPSNPKKVSEQDGKSPASARSPETPVTA